MLSHASFYAAVLWFAIPLAAQTEFLANGDFETGTFDGWTVTDNGNGFIEINDGTLVPGGIGAAQPPLGGAFDAVTNGGGPGDHRISQQFVVPTNLTLAQLSWDDQINNFAAVFADPGQEFRVLIEDVATATVTEVFSTNAGDGLVQPTTARSFDVLPILAPLAGQTARIIFEEQDNLFFFNVILDNCSLLLDAAGGIATFETYGDGCGRGTGSSFYEVFDDVTNPIDMIGGGFTMILAGGTYTVVPPLSGFVAPTTLDLGLGDDAIQNVVLPSTGNWIAGFPHATGVVTSIDVDSNGSVFFEPGAASDFTPTLAEFFGGMARVAPMASDFDPTAGGTVHAEQDPANPDQFHITWSMVPNFSGTAMADMQVTLDVVTASIEVNYGAGHTASGNPAGGIVGYTPGGGASDPGPRDISADSAIGFSTGNDNSDIAFDSVAGDRPIIGQTFSMEITNLPTTSLGGTVLMFTAPQVPGIDLGLIGLASGCDFLLAGGQITELPIPGGVSPTASLTLDLTNAGPALAGFQLFAQPIVIGVPNVPPFGLATANGGAITISVN